MHVIRGLHAGGAARPEMALARLLFGIPFPCPWFPS